MRTRELLPGAAIAALLTASALLALLVGLGMRGDGPLALDLGGSDRSAQLRGGEGQGAGTTGVGGRRPASLTLPSVASGGSGDAPASATRAAGRRRTTSALQGAAGRGRAGARETTPALRTPSATPAPAATTTRPAATSTPNPVAVKVRGRGTPAPSKPVAKTRVAPPPSGTAAPRSSAPAPSAPAPPVHVERVAPPAAPTPSAPVVVVRVPRSTSP
jgi:hypothetical protein